MFICLDFEMALARGGDLEKYLSLTHLITSYSLCLQFTAEGVILSVQ